TMKSNYVLVLLSVLMAVSTCLYVIKDNVVVEQPMDAEAEHLHDECYDDDKYYEEGNYSEVVYFTVWLKNELQ
ncbi:hypothetical protein EWB00_003850, partial [Schistosoma japonicum]